MSCSSSCMGNTFLRCYKCFIVASSDPNIKVGILYRLCSVIPALIRTKLLKTFHSILLKHKLLATFGCRVNICRQSVLCSM